MSSTNEWPLVKLGKLVEKTSETKGGSDIPVYSITKHAGFVSEYFKKNVHSKDQSKYKVVNEGEFAYATIHLDEGSIGIAPEKAAVSPMYTTFRIISADIDPQFLLRFLKSDAALAQYAILGTGSIERRKNINFEAFSRLSIPIPPLAEQQRIAGVLNQTTSILELARQEVREIDESRSALFESLFPASNYPVSTIGNFFSETQYGSSKKSGEAGKYPMLRMGNLSSTGSISYSDLKYLDLEEKEINKYTLRNRDILFNRTNSKELVGKTAVYYGEGDQVAYAGYLIRCRTNDLATPEFISGFLNSRIGKAQLFQRAKAIVGMANINAKELRTLRIPSVPVAEQEKYTSVSRQLEDLRLAVEKKIEKLEELQKSLSTRAFAGQL